MKKSNEEIKATANHSKRTFTLRQYIDGKLFAKYRTHSMNKDEFNSNEYNTQNDWKHFLKTNSYYKV